MKDADEAVAKDVAFNSPGKPCKPKDFDVINLDGSPTRRVGQRNLVEMYRRVAVNLSDGN